MSELRFQDCNKEQCEDVIDGAWGDWGDWGAGEDASYTALSCTKPCGGGYQWRVRDYIWSNSKLERISSNF